MVSWKNHLLMCKPGIYCETGIGDCGCRLSLYRSSVPGNVGFSSEGERMADWGEWHSRECAFPHYCWRSRTAV